MKKTFAKDLIKRISVALALLVVVGVSIIGYINTTVNYSLIDYLDESCNTRQGLEITQEEFGGTSYARVMVENIDIMNANDLKQSLATIDGISYVLWLDDMIDMVGQQLADKIAEEEKDSPSGAFDATTIINEVFDKFAIAIPEELRGFIELFKDGYNKTEVLDYVDKNPIILDTIDLVFQYYFDGALSLTNYYNSADKAALFEVYFLEDDYSDETKNAIIAIKNKCSNLDAAYDGTAISTRAAIDTTESEMIKLILIVAPLIILILFLATKSYMEPILFLVTIGIAVVINMGSNIMFEKLGLLNGISFITSGMAAALQLAISMDYAIFILHKYQEKLLVYKKDKKTAVKKAVKESFVPILASCLTSVAGFIAISFMQFGIGKDIGFVFIKGIIVSFIVSLLVMPFLIQVFDKLLVKWQHKSLMPTGKKLIQFIVKSNVVILIGVVGLTVFAYTRNDDLTYLYGESSISSSEGTETYEDSKRIQEEFGVYNPILIVVPKSIRATDRDEKIVNEILDIRYNNKQIINGVMSYTSIVKEGMEDMIPQELISNFDSENYTRIVVKVNAEGETDEAFYVYEELKQILVKYSNEYYITGSTVGAYDIKNIIQSDYDLVNLIAIIAVFVIILFSFKSIIIPILLVATIEAGIYINVGITSFGDGPISFLGYLVVSLIQLGATIDYAILLTRNYVDNRKLYNRNIAMSEAIKQSIVSILTSALILAVCGYSIGISSSVKGVSDIGTMIGRGAVISGVLVLVFLPLLLRLSDKLIAKLSIGMKFYQDGSTKETIKALKDIELFENRKK